MQSKECALISNPPPDGVVSKEKRARCKKKVVVVGPTLRIWGQGGEKGKRSGLSIGH